MKLSDHETIIGICIVLSLIGSFWAHQLKQPKGELISISVDIGYCYVIPEGTAKVSRDLEKYIGYGFVYPDRGLTLITGTYPFCKKTIMIRGNQKARKAELLLLDREMLKKVKKEE